MATQQHTPNNTPQNKQEKSSFRTLLNYIWKWLRQNFWLVMAVLVLGVVLSAQQEMLTALAKRTFVGLCHSCLGLGGLWAAMGAVILGVGVKICERFRHHSTADPRSVFLAFILLGLGLYLAFAFPFWQMHRWQTIATAAAFCLIVLGTTALWLVLPLHYFFLNHSEYRRLEAEKKAAYEDSFLVLDNPIGKDNEDLSIETSYISQLQNLIDSFPLDHTGTIAVTGAWGSGKTSHINVLESMLGAEDYLFVRFEPMKCERPELIQSAFFDQLEDKLSDYRSGFPRYFRHYKELLGVIDSKYSKFVTTLFSISQEEARDRINHAIQNLHRRIVVFIDDVDRLDRQELEQVFRLVGFNAKFNSLVFLLAMDKTRVEATMGATDNFSDKFAEVEFYLPRMSPNDIVRFVIDNIKISSIGQYAKQAVENDLDGNVADIVKHCLPTMRDAKRFVNSFLLRLELMDKSDEYIFRDYYLLSLLHYADPNAFDVLAQNESFGADVVHKGLTINRSNLCGAKSESDDILWQLVQTLFPSKGIIQVVGARHGINDNDYIFIYFNEVYRSSSASAQSNGQVPPSPQPKPNTPQGSQSPQSGQNRHPTQGTQGSQPQNPNTTQGSQSSQSPRSGQSQHSTQGTQGAQPQNPNTPRGSQSPQSGQRQHTTQGTQGSQPRNPNVPQGPQPPQTPANLNVFSVANMQYMLSLPMYDDIEKLLNSWKYDVLLYANVKKYFENYQIDKLSNDDSRVGKYFIVCHSLGIQELDFFEGFAVVKKGGKWGFVDQDGTVKIPIEYDRAYRFSHGLAIVEKGGKYGFVDKTGTVKVPIEYDRAYRFFYGLAKVMKGGKWGFVDKAGAVIVPIEYDDVYDFSEGLAKVRKGGKWGYVDNDGAERVPREYDYIDEFSEGLARVKKGRKWGFVDKNGAVIVPIEYDDVSRFTEGLAMVKKGGKFGYFDQAGAVKVPIEYDDVEWFSEGLAAVKKGGKWGFVDKAGKVIVPIEYDNAWSFSEDLAAVKKGGKWGFIDVDGAVKVPIEYDGARPFSEGLAAVRKGGKWGYIDQSGAVKIPFEYDDAWRFSNGRARVQKYGKWFYIDKEGKWVR